MLLDILRDGLSDDELTTTDISRRELALDKELIQLIQLACKNERLARAIDLTKLLHHTASFDMAIKVAKFYHQIGLEEKMEMLKQDREDVDRLEVARERRRERASEFAPVPAMQTAYASSVGPERPKAFQDFRPPPAIHRPGLERASASASGDAFKSGGAGPSRQRRDEFQSTAADVGDEYANDASADGKRKRSVEPFPELDSQSYGKRRATESGVQPSTCIRVQMCDRTR